MILRLNWSEHKEDMQVQVSGIFAQTHTHTHTRTHTCTAELQLIYALGAPPPSHPVQPHTHSMHTQHTSLSLLLNLSLSLSLHLPPPLRSASLLNFSLLLWISFLLTWNFFLATKYCILRRTLTADLWAWDNLWQKGRLIYLKRKTMMGKCADVSLL